MGQERIQGRGTFFNNAFDEYNFSIISNLCDKNNSYDLYRYTEIEKCEKIASYRYLVKTSKLRAKTSNTICLKTCARSTKMAIIECKFSKVFRESMPPDLRKTVTVLILLQTNSAEKSTLKNVKIWRPPPKKILVTFLA